MDKIKVLDKSTSELIAAGEVVERPASIVKELVENSIDANATQITIEISNGGITFIKISDNGIGMSANDVVTAFLRHATSKIKDKNDLNRINSLGFRGEALCAIAIVSKIEIFTKEKDANLGYKLKIDGSVVVNSEEIGCPVGTTIIVRDVFFNTPARLSFLKKESTEAAYIYDIIEKLALSHANISFRLINNAKETFYSSGSGDVLELMQELYTKAYRVNALEVCYEKDFIKVDGYTLKPTISKANRQMQIYFINGRYIKNSIITRALEAAYKNSIMVHKFPVAFLYITIEPSFVDVNVHPTKLEVKFKDESRVYNAVYFAVKDALEKDNGHLIYEAKEKNSNNENTKNVFEIFDKIKAEQKEYKVSEHSVIINPTINKNNFIMNDSARNIVINPKEVWTVAKNEQPIEVEQIQNSKVQEVQIKEILKDKNIDEQIELEKEKISYKIIGEIFDSYIILQQENSMLLIDKHAAHERLIYEDLLVNNNIFKQMLLLPITVVLSKTNCDIAISNIDKLDEYGFTIESFGETTIIVRAVPTILAEENIEDTLEEILACLIIESNDIKTKAHEDILHTIACKAAIKAGSYTSFLERDSFVKRLMNTPNIKYCPHGRPVISEITKKEIEKMFKRI